MKTSLYGHPAVEFAAWLKSKRRARGTVARVFAGRIDLSPAEYAEVESGVVRWIESKQELMIPVMLDLDSTEAEEFAHKLYLAREAGPLEFVDIYSREELSPARYSTVDGQQISEDKREAIINAVFTPLV